MTILYLVQYTIDKEQADDYRRPLVPGGEIWSNRLTTLCVNNEAENEELTSEK